MARKKVRGMRAEEKRKLEMNLESLLRKRAETRQRRSDYPPSAPYLLHQSPVYIETPEDFTLPRSFGVLLKELQESLYMVDPLNSLIDKKDGHGRTQAVCNRRF